MHAAVAMSHIPEGVWPDAMQNLQLKQVQISTVPHKMAYDLTKFEVSPGQPVEITIVNPDAKPPNLVVSKPGSLRSIGPAADAQGTNPDACARDDHPDRIL